MSVHPSARRDAGPRILFVCDADAPFAVSAMQECLQLCHALAAADKPPVVFRNWPGTGSPSEDRHAAKVQDTPYPIFCSRAVRAEAALLALLERPTIAITLGCDPVGLAQPLLDAGIPSIAWFVDFPGCQVLPVGAQDRRLGLVAASTALAAHIAALLGKPVATLLAPLAREARLAGQGADLLIPSLRRADGVQRIFDMARARPQYTFKALANPAQIHAEQAVLAGAPSNVSCLEAGQKASHFRAALLPTFHADLPWSPLAECLHAGLPVLGSTEPLLVEAVAEAGCFLRVTDSLAAWLDQLDDLMQNNARHASLSQAAIQRGKLLRLSPNEAAQQCMQVVGEHLACSALLLSGRL